MRGLRERATLASGGGKDGGTTSTRGPASGHRRAPLADGAVGAVIVVATAALQLAGCGSGSAARNVGASAGALPPGIAPRAAHAAVVLLFPAPAPRASHARGPAYISPATNGLGISVRASGGAAFPASTAPMVAADVSVTSPLCVLTNGGPARTCTVPVPASAGTDDFEVTAWDAPPAGGGFASAHRLSAATVLGRAIAPGVVNQVSFTLNGVVDSVALGVSPSTITAGVPTTLALSVTASDAAGNVILAPGSYADANGNSLTLTITRSEAGAVASGTMTTPGPVTAPGGTLSVSYNGNSAYSATFGVSASGPIAGAVSPATVTLTPTIYEYSAGITSGAAPWGIAAEADGNVWFTENNGNRLARITPSGSVTEYGAGLTSGAVPRGITEGPDGRVWFVEFMNNAVGAATTATGAVTAEYDPGFYGHPQQIAVGPDGNLWFTGTTGSVIGRITPSGAVTPFLSGNPTGNQSGTYTLGITAGPDGNIWYTQPDYGVARMTPSGTVTEFAAGITPNSQPCGITSGPDGNLWFAESAANQIAKITPSGTVTEFSAGITPNSGPCYIATGVDGNLWFTEKDASRIGRITPAGVVTEFSAGITPNSIPLGIAVDAGGNIWFAENNADRVGKLVY